MFAQILILMSILKFTIPSDSKIMEDIKNNQNAIKFIGNGSICQNIKETTYIRLIQFNNEDSVKKVIYKKNGVCWGLKSVEVVNF